MADSFRGPSETLHTETLTEQHLIFHIQCQLAKAVADAVELDQANAGNAPAALRATWLKDWGAKVSLVMSVNNKNNVSPSLSFTKTLENAVTVFTQNGNVTTGQNRSVGLGCSGQKFDQNSQDAERRSISTAHDTELSAWWPGGSRPGEEPALTR